MWRNCWSRVERFPAAIFLQFTRSEKCNLSSKRATVRALTRMPSRWSCLAILAVVWCVHLRLLIGSPAVSCSSSLSIREITWGVFFPRAGGLRRVCVPVPTPLPVPAIAFARVPPYVYPVGATRPVSDRPAAQLQRFQSGIQTALALVQQAG